MDEKVETTTTTTTTYAQTTSIAFNAEYVKSPAGILKIVEFVFGLLCWALCAEISPFSPAHQYVMFVGVTSWVLTMVTFIIFLFALHETSCPGMPMEVIEFGFNVFCAVLYFIAACISAAYVYGWGQLVASTVFAFFTTIAYIIHIPVSYKARKGWYPWDSSAGVSVTA